MLFVTDIGKDVDDAVALTYAIIAGIPIKTIITTSKDAVDAGKICKNILDNLSDRYPRVKRIKIYAGSTEPLRRGVTHGCTYTGSFRRGDFSIEKFEPMKVDKDDAIVICPLTDVARLMENGRIKRAIFMGQARKDGGALKANLDAYNFKCDPFASEVVFQFQNTVPFAFVGKTLAYRVPLRIPDFEMLAATGHPVGEFLANHAFETFDHFKTNVPEIYERVYKGTDNISYCYDPLTVLALKHPEIFIFEPFGDHRIAVDIFPDKAKSILLETLKKGLS